MTNKNDLNNDGWLGANDVTFYNTTRLILVAFSTLFNNININSNNKLITVPLTYASRERYLTFINRLGRDGNLKVATALPQMAFDYTDIRRDNMRTPIQTSVLQPNSDSDYNKQYMMNAIPYMMDIDLNIVTKNQMDASQIFERILPSFNPSLFLKVKDMQIFNRQTDVEFIYNGLDHSVVYEEDYSSIMFVRHTLHFTVKYYYYTPVRKSDIIKHIIIDYTDEQIDKLLGTSFIDVVPDTANRNDPHDIVITREGEL